MKTEANEPLLLLPCPFCGGVADLSFEHSKSHPDWWKVTCVECGGRTISNTTDKYKAIRLWNNRVYTTESNTSTEN